MSNKILKIEEGIWDKRGEHASEDSGYEGYLITTEKGKLVLGISAFTKCCEDSGYLMSEDKLDEFIGATLISYEPVGGPIKGSPDTGEACTYFVNLHTSKGLLQFTAYNEHEGFYGHDVMISFAGVEEKWSGVWL